MSRLLFHLPFSPSVACFYVTNHLKTKWLQTLIYSFSWFQCWLDGSAGLTWPGDGLGLLLRRVGFTTYGHSGGLFGFPHFLVVIRVVRLTWWLTPTRLNRDHEASEKASITNTFQVLGPSLFVQRWSLSWFWCVFHNHLCIFATNVGTYSWIVWSLFIYSPAPLSDGVMLWDMH